MMFNPVQTQRCFNVYTASIALGRRRMSVIMTSYERYNDVCKVRNSQLTHTFSTDNMVQKNTDQTV